MKQRILEGKTKVVVTLGPSSSSKEILREFFRLGVDVFRLNFSHGSFEEHLERINIIRELEEEFGTKVSILQDLQGPKIRLETFKDGLAILKEGSQFILSKTSVLGDDKTASLTYPEVLEDVKVGDEVYINDGLVKLKVLAKKEDHVITEVMQGGEVSDHKGVNFPHSRIQIKAITEKDLSDLKFGIENGVDIVALSFVRSKNDVAELRNYMQRFGRLLPIVSKVEKWEAIENFPEILSESDAVMVARGDLGVEVPVRKVPLLQKELIKLSNDKGVPVITATQMLASMTEEQFPTRAEVTDVANAIFDGSDAVMLSNETASGKYPVLALSMMRSIIKEVENSKFFSISIKNLDPEFYESNLQEVLAKSVKDITSQFKINLIIVATESGKTARLISKYKPNVPILALTPKEEALRLLNLKWGVFSYLVKPFSSVDEILDYAPKIALELGILSVGQSYLIACGTHTGVSGTTNLIKIDKV
ncbi:MAG: pyruvate kinase [Caldisericaceae bacterium]